MTSWIVIAGGAGFVGSNLTRAYLATGHGVVVVDDASTGRWSNLPEHPLLRRVDHDVRRPCVEPVAAALPGGASVLAVCNLASPASPPAYLARPIDTLQIGSLGTQHLIEVALAHGARFLQASTSEVYGDPSVHPQPEAYWGNVNPIGPRSVYDEAKRYGEALCCAYERHEGLELRLVRIFNTYGPRMQADDGRVVTNFVNQALRGEPLTVYGEGTQTRSFCFVDDLVRGLMALVASEVRGPVNLGNPGEFTMLELAQLVQELTESLSPILHEDLPVDDPRQRRPDITRASELLGWSPDVELREGLRRTIDWFRSSAPARGAGLAAAPTELPLVTSPR
jgi:dTDP-glucose 4,6-dehydratase